MTNSCDACQQEHKKYLFIACPLQPCNQRNSCGRHPSEDSFVVNNEKKEFLGANGPWDPKMSGRNAYKQLTSSLKHQFVHPPTQPTI
ncbi:hypothetical protein O181_010542 [Austropuccinia psidii MF-1]|uniref:Uncharacterized protein n=1 Tax=Austropuccinia psidii MF-1 TaxID=1389203 RepID=A0A9Q3BSU2_9BASI|nr:hypothetical protein [Austropuccinia psidii MF-1]